MISVNVDRCAHWPTKVRKAISSQSRTWRLWRAMAQFGLSLTISSMP
jgi:hypothetical protein